MTLRECLVVTAYTGINMVLPFSVFHEFAEKKLNRPILTHEFAEKEVWNELRAATRDDFIKLCKRAKDNPTDKQTNKPKES